MMNRKNRGLRSGPGSGNLICKEPIEVYCRVKPKLNSDESCISVIPPNQIEINPPITNFRYGGSNKAMLYTFRRVFDETASQKCVFANTALPLIDKLLSGKNGLLFTYGVTGSGKTFTMTGTEHDGGILPRCLDTIFNSIVECQAKKHVFKPDRLNGFDIQSEEEALADKEQDLLAQLTRGNRNKLKGSDPDLVGRIRETTKLDSVDEDYVYAVFITFVEIYNNTVYDLLEDVFEDGNKARPLQTKIVREDSARNMYVHAANELEVFTTDEAFEIFYRAQKRKRVAQTQLNQESSRSHSIFTIRVVQAPLDNDGEKVVADKKSMVISQLSLVDLAGSERTNRTKNTGQRLKEAGNINNSLLTLRTCLELLRENQNGANKIIPYRESRLTHLFKNYFDGEGQVAMIVCVSQLLDCYDENLQVMKFAEMSQEVQITCPPPVRPATCYTPGRRRANIAFKEAINGEGLNINPLTVGAGDTVAPSTSVVSKVISNGVPKGLGLFGHSFIDIPDLRFIDSDDNKPIPEFCNYMEENLRRFCELSEEFQKKRFDFRNVLMQSERQAFSSSQEVQSWKSLYEKEKEKINAFEARASSSDGLAAKYKRKLDENEVALKRMKQELSEKQSLLSQNKAETNKVKEHYSNKLTQAQEKLSKEMERKLRSQKSAMEFELRNKDDRLKAVRRLLSDENLKGFDNVPGNRARLPVDTKSVESLISSVGTPCSVGSSVAATPVTATPVPALRSTGRKMGVPVVNRRHRRSRSAGDVWLEHKPKTPVPLGTLMQPTMAKRKSVSKLTDAKDVTEKTSKYCLMTQNQDSDGDIETRLYKADVIPTAGGGAQVMFNDVEVLKQISPTVSPSRKRPDEIRRDIEAACSVAMEGHKMRRKNN